MLSFFYIKLTNYVKHDKILISIRICENQKGEHTMSLQRKLKKVSAKNRLRKCLTRKIGKIFEELPPKYYDEILCSLDEGELENLMLELNEQSQSYFWKCLSSITLANLLKRGSECGKEICEFMPNYKLEQVIEQDSEVAWKFFIYLEPGAFFQKALVLERLTTSGLEKFLDNIMVYANYARPKAFNEFLAFLNDRDYYDEVQEVYRKMAAISKFTIARFLNSSEVTPEISINVFSYLEDRKKTEEVYRRMKSEKLYEILKESDFQLLNGEAQLPIENFSTEAQEELFCILKESGRRFDDIFDVRRIVSLYRVLEPEDKLYLIEHMLLDNVREFYEILEKDEKEELIELLDKGGSELIIEYVLKRKDISYFERLVLKELSQKA